MRTGIKVQVSATDRTQLDAIVADRNAPQKHVWRAQIVLLTADGCGTAEIMRDAGVSKTAVWRWQERFMTDGVAGLLRDKTRRSRIPPLEVQTVARVVAATRTDPPGETTHWTAAAMAKVQGISVSSVQRIWRRHGLQPHRTRLFKLSNDPQFASKLQEIVGLYVEPPAHAVVLSIDEKSQIQALDRTQPGLPLKKGRCGTMTHDYIRNGTTTLFAALNVLDGKVIGRCMQQHRHQEFIRFLNTVEAAVPTSVSLSMASSTTTPPTSIPRSVSGSPDTRVGRSLLRLPLPLGSSAVEGYFAKLTRRRLKRGVFRSIVELQAAIKRFLAETNADPRPFRWTKDPDKIIAAVKRGHQVLDSIHSHVRHFKLQAQKFLACPSNCSA